MELIKALQVLWHVARIKGQKQIRPHIRSLQPSLFVNVIRTLFEAMHPLEVNRKLVPNKLRTYGTSVLSRK